MASVVIRKYDELIRCTNVLTEGIEQEFIKFVVHQEHCRKQWQAIQEESHESKKFITKYKAEQDTLEVKLKMARHQLDVEMKKRLKAEQTVDHMARQLELIKELLLDKDTDKEKLAQSIYKYDKTGQVIPDASLHISYTMDSSAELPDSEYDISENDILDETGVPFGDGRKGGKRGHPSAPPLQPPTSTDETSEDGDYAKRTRVSEEDSTGFTNVTRVSEVHRSVQTHKTRRSTSHSNYQSQQVEKQTMMSSNHIKEFIGNSITLSSDSYDTDEVYDKENPIPPIPDKNKHNTATNLYPNLEELGTPPHKKNDSSSSTSLSSTSNSSANHPSSLHSFVTKIAVRMETCSPCNKKLRFGSNVMKCKECKIVCHPECREKVTTSCYPAKDTPVRKEGAVECYIEGKKSQQIPDLVTKCIEEIENRGLKQQGLYRIPGSDKDVKELKEKFLRKKNPDLSKISDIHVICGCLNDFLRGLSEPLVTFSLHRSFMAAAVTADIDDKLNAIYQCINELPSANQETLAAIIIHLQKVVNSVETQMSNSKLSNVFGPTLVGYGSSNPTHEEMLEDTKHQKVVVTCLLGISKDFWNQYVHGSVPSHMSKTPLAARSPPYNPSFKTPTTPEFKEPLETKLGPTDPTSQMRNNTRKAYNAMTPKVVSKDGRRQRHFFNSPS